MRIGAAMLSGLGLMLTAGPSLALEPRDHPNANLLPRPDFAPDTAAAPFELPPVPGAAPWRSLATGPVLRAVRFRGNRFIGTRELEQVAAPWMGHPAALVELESLRLELTRHCIARGFINSGALLLEPALTPEGEALFEIVEGRLSELRISGLERLDPRYLEGRLRPDPEAPLDADALRERFQRLLDDPLFARLNARLEPGVARGQAILHVDAVRARAWDLTLLANNYRPPAIGEAVAGAQAVLRNLTGRGDQLEVQAQKPWQRTDAQRVGVAWRLPVNFQGSWVSLQADEGEAFVVEAPLVDLGIRSRIQSWELGAGHALVDGLRHRFAFGASLQGRVNRTWLDGQPFSFVAGEPDGVTRATTARLWQEATWRTERQVVALRSTLAGTRNNLRTIPGLPSAPQADDAYVFWLAQGQWVRKLTAGGTLLNLRFAAQFATQRMLSLDGLSLGGVNTVRGFRENQLIRDAGAVATVELDIPVWGLSGEKRGLSVLPFIDAARGRNVSEAPDTLSSAGLALRWRLGGGVTLDAAWAKRLARPSNIGLGEGSLQDSGVHLQLAWRL